MAPWNVVDVTRGLQQNRVSLVVQDHIVVCVSQLALPPPKPTVLGTLVCWATIRQVAKLSSVCGKHPRRKPHFHHVAPVLSSVCEQRVQIYALGVF